MTPRILIAREAADAAKLIARLHADGYNAVAIAPTFIETLSLSPEYTLPGSFRWIAFTSAKTVAHFAALLAERGWKISSETRLAAVGKATAKAVMDQFERLDLRGNGTGEELGAAILAASNGTSGTMLFPCAEVTSGGFEAIMHDAGWVIERLPLYRTVPRSERELSAEIGDVSQWSIVVYYAPSGVKAMIGAVPDLRKCLAIAIGKTTENALYEAYAVTVRTAAEPSEDAIYEQIERVLKTPV